MEKDRNLVQEFNRFEEQHSLLEKKYNDLLIWPLVREKIFSLVEEHSLSHEKKGQPDIETGISEILKIIPRILKNISAHLFKKKESADVIFIAHPRRKERDGAYIDIYTDPLIDNIQCSNVVLEPMFQLKHFIPAKPKHIHYLDFIDLWSRGLSLFKRDKLIGEKRQFWFDISDSLADTFQVPRFNIVKYIELEITRFRLAYPHIKKMLELVSPQVIIEVVGYQRLIKFINIVAEELNIPTAELQHGYLGKYHIAYNYPLYTKSPSFPDYLLVWGDFWKKNIVPPIDTTKILITGFEYFNQNLRSTFPKNANVKKQFLFISQATIGKKLAEKAIELSKIERFSEFEILFKLHPTEFNNQQKKYKHLYKNENVRVIDSESTKDLYELIYESSVIFGVYSTALIEALGLGKKVIILKIEGWRAMKELAEDEHLDIKIIESLEDEGLMVSEVSTKTEYLFAPTDHSWLRQFTDPAIKFHK